MDKIFRILNSAQVNMDDYTQLELGDIEKKQMKMNFRKLKNTNVKSIKKQVFKYSAIALCIGTIFFGTVFCYSNYFSPIRTERISSISYKGFSDVTELSNYADIIVVAQPEKNIEECQPTIKYTQAGRIEDAYTVTNFKTLKTLKGDSLKNIDVVQPVVIFTQGINRVCRIASEYYTPAEKNNKYLLFLKKLENSNLYSIVSAESGKYNLYGTDKNEKNITEKSEYFKKLKDLVINKYQEVF
jgi:hypothetical protein